MSLKTTFIKAAKTVFKVFKSLVVNATYTVIVDSGFGPSTRKEYPIELIMDNFAERDVQFLSFSNLIQPTDVKGLVRGDQLTDVKVATQHTIKVDVKEYAIVAFNVDPAGALYTFLLRKT